VLDYIHNTFKNSHQYEKLFLQFYGKKLKSLDRALRLSNASQEKPDILILIEAPQVVIRD